MDEAVLVMPATLITGMAAVLAVIAAREGVRWIARMWVSVMMVAAVAAMIAMVVGAARDEPPSVDRLQACSETGSVQMVSIDGRWTCVPPGQEG